MNIEDFNAPRMFGKSLELVQDVKYLGVASKVKMIWRVYYYNLAAKRYDRENLGI